MTDPSAKDRPRDEDVPCAKPACEHHWVYAHQRDFPRRIPWVGTCSLCGDINSRDLHRELWRTVPVIGAVRRKRDHLAMRYGWTWLKTRRWSS